MAGTRFAAVETVDRCGWIALSSNVIENVRANDVLATKADEHLTACSYCTSLCRIVADVERRARRCLSSFQKLAL